MKGIRKYLLLHTLLMFLATTDVWAQASRRNIQKSGSCNVAAQRADAGNAFCLEVRRGELWAWGKNDFGQLGDSSTTNRLAPKKIGSATNWSVVSAGVSHSLAVRADGSLWGWGRNNYGQVGDGSTTSRSFPVRIGTANDWISVAAGNGHSLALKADGSLWGWGFNNNGQVGDGSTTNRNAPVRLGTANDWIYITAGYTHSLAIKSNGTLWGWGDNIFNKLGTGTATTNVTPVQVGTDNNWVQVSAGEQHSMGIKSNGTLWGWGSNSWGQLGTGNVTNGYYQIGSLSTWVMVQAGASHTLALKADGTVWGSGNNNDGQLGDGTVAARASFVQAINFLNVVAITIGDGFSFALQANGVLNGAGTSAVGQLGKGSTSSFSYFVPVSTSFGWVEHASGYAHNLMIANSGRLLAWGQNSSGELGDASSTNRLTRVTIGTASNWKCVATGSSFSLGIRADGTLWAWGKNTFGQLGDGTTVNKSVPLQIGTANNWVAIAAGDNHSLGLRSDGTLWAWGRNTYGQLGDGTVTTRTAPIQIGTANSWVSIATGLDHSLAVRSNGTIWAWGRNNSSQLGDGATTDRTAPAQIGTSTLWLKASGGNSHSVGLRCDGSLWSWGLNSNGQLGDSTTVTRTTPIKIVTKTPTNDTCWMDVDAGADFCIAIRNTGSGWGWGANTYGQLGDNSTTGRIFPVNNASQVQAVTAGAGFSGIIKTNRNQNCLSGLNTSGQLGTGNTTNASTYNSCYTYSNFNPSIGNPTPVSACVGLNATFSVTLTASATAFYQWQIDSGGGFVHLKNSSVYSGTNSSSLVVTGVTLAMGGHLFRCIGYSPEGSDTSSSATLTVNTTPAAPGAIYGDTSTCALSPKLYYTTPVNGASSYSWTRPAGWTGTSTNDSITLTPGTSGGTITVRAVNLCGNSSAASLNVTSSATVNVSVQISASQTTVCAGSQVTFTANPTNGGTSPVFQWKRNGTNVGTNSATYTPSNLATGDSIRCTMVSSLPCPIPSLAVSNQITVTVSQPVTPSVSITASQTSICSGVTVTFTASPSNGGTTPSYQWKINGNNAGTNSVTFSTNTLANNDQVSCVMTSSASCVTTATATSNVITMTTQSITPSLNISTGSTTLCAGTSVTFTASPTNGGTAPSYQWKVNGNNVGTNTATFASTTLANNDQVTCAMTSNASCLTTSTATSNTITVTVNANVTPSVTISTQQTTICSGASATFNATVTNGGVSPSYQWKTDTVNAGTNSASFTTSSLTNGQVVTCVVTSSAACANPMNVTSNAVTMTVQSVTTPTVSITASQTSICSGATVTFTAIPSNGGASPSYQWKVNGNNVGANQATFASNTFSNNDQVTCVMTSNAACVTTTTSTSNAITLTTQSITPSVSVTSASTTICSGASVAFYATPTNGGTLPSYQWKVNGNNSGTSADSFVVNNLTNGDQITCVMTSNASCLTSSMATSNAVTVSVTSAVTPTISVSASSSNICQGESVTFTATVTNEGSGPAYQWKVNGNNTSSNAASLVTSTLVNGDVVTCVLTSNAACASPTNATSSAVTITVNAPSTPAITISASQTVLCSGVTVYFNATPVNGGATPSYQWRINSANVGNDSSGFSSSGLTATDQVSCIMTSSAGCVTTNAATSNLITFTTGTVTPEVSVSVSDSDVCAGTLVAFTASPVNGGSLPSYQWKINGTNAGNNSATFSSSSLANQDKVSCTMTSNAGCLSTSTATSNVVEMGVTPLPLATISVSQDTIRVVETTGANYQWMNCANNQPVNGATSSYLKVLVSGSYKVEVTLNGCSSLSSCEPVNALSSGVAEISQQTVNLFPNPARNMVKVVSAFPVEQIDIYNALGQLISTQPVNNQTEVMVPVGAAAGIYYMRVKTLGNSAQASVRFLVE